MNDPLEPLRKRFRERAAGEAEALERALADADWAEVERLIHGLAGSAGIFGLTKTSAAASELDRVFAEGKRPEVEQVRGLVATIRRELGDYS